MKTQKKMKVIGTQNYINAETGELVECQVMKIEERDANFHKIWLGHVIETLDIVGNQKIRLITFILSNLDKENKLVMTQRKIAAESGISVRTVTDTLKILQEADFLIRINAGAYRVHPEKIWKGSARERMNVLLQYTNSRSENSVRLQRKENRSANLLP